jgi:hypothetical protein
MPIAVHLGAPCPGELLPAYPRFHLSLARFDTLAINDPNGVQALARISRDGQSGCRSHHSDRGETRNTPIHEYTVTFHMLWEAAAAAAGPPAAAASART